MNGTATLERDDIQGLIFSAYAHLPFAAFLLLRIDDPAAARRWLGGARDWVTSAVARNDNHSTNIALTREGLARLGLSERTLATFSFAFKEGMVSAHRSRSLGDVGPSAPEHWNWGTDPALHVALLLYARTPATRKSLLAQIARELSDAGLTPLHILHSDTEADRREHFGFKDGIGQPVMAGTGNEKHQFARTRHATTLPPGEFLLGHPNLYGQKSESPNVAQSDDPAGVLGRGGDLGRNGTYLVFRQIEQDVAKFWQFVRDDELAAKFVGRWPGGAPLVLAPGADDPALANRNDFSYAADDPAGLRCPTGAHVRRANPRDTNGIDPRTKLPMASLHRIMRRGRSYGPPIVDRMKPDGEPRGLHFICFNADLERQFELVAQSWINAPIFAGLAGEVDPLVGDVTRGDGLFTIQAEPLRRRIHGLERFVTVRGGAYFFMPSLRALRYLSTL